MWRHHIAKNYHSNKATIDSKWNITSLIHTKQYIDKASLPLLNTTEAREQLLPITLSIVWFKGKKTYIWYTFIRTRENLWLWR